MGGDLDMIVARLSAGVAGSGRALVAIDGVGGSGKTTFAETLADRVEARPVVVVHVDDFFNPSAVRHARGRESSEGFWLDAYNYDALASWTLGPLSAGGDGSYCPGSYDHARDSTVQPDRRMAPRDALVLVEGTFLHRDELARFWDFSIFLDVPFEEATRRMARRDAVDPDVERGRMRRYVGAQQMYFACATPWERASLVVDNTDLDNPRIIDVASVTAR
ncbi:uridine kinase [Cellulomonas chengniuliangii]|uniref:Uridine kinase n=1 Tax=Cellulomonas chengniuliangii TaxID=2968084 RepID=A0ABY5KVA8_9CELL|nr:uridine kinase [Cellulomonas chengniuliangii]MCC2308869.1 uridine kinase [Cellulomonas chengniuliangii]UUI74390.1 uridine kinase [Cellulomonas chengniuliangii]